MKKIIYLSTFLALNTFFVFRICAQIKEAKTTTFPVYKDTGNPQQDNQRYAIEKRAWAEANPNINSTTTNSGQRLEEANTAAALIPTTSNTENTPTIPLMIPPYNPEQFEKERQKEQAKAAEEQANEIAKLVIEQPAAVIAPPTKVPTHLVAKGYIEKSTSEVNIVETNNVSGNAGKVNIFPIGDVPNSNETIQEPAKPNQPLEKHIVTKDDLNKMSAEKLAYVKAHLDVYEIATEEQLNLQVEKYELTKEDYANYDKAKQTWIATHPDEYAKMNSLEKTTAKHFISKQEFDNMPVEKQQKILQNLDLYVIGSVQNK